VKATSGAGNDTKSWRRLQCLYSAQCRAKWRLAKLKLTLGLYIFFSFLGLAEDSKTRLEQRICKKYCNKLSCIRPILLSLSFSLFRSFFLTLSLYILSLSFSLSLSSSLFLSYYPRLSLCLSFARSLFYLPNSGGTSLGTRDSWVDSLGKFWGRARRIESLAEE
jgi:hypothetical protein